MSKQELLESLLSVGTRKNKHAFIQQLSSARTLPMTDMTARRQNLARPKKSDQVREN
ncbi:MAG: hypothetical protein JKY29_13740 [Gammaproteobacteria bacterium]|nr:hypothetical protein [Gammaproteobacteria bacterium]